MRQLKVALVLVALLATRADAQRAQTYEALTVGAAPAVGITAATLTNMGACRGVVETAEIRMRADGTDPTATVGTPVSVGGTIDFDSTIDARFAKFIRTTGTSATLHVNCWQK